MGGNWGRRIHFNTASGEVLLHRLAGAGRSTSVQCELANGRSDW
jgi:hypothetical protein